MSNLIRRKISGQGIYRRLFAALCLAFLLTGCQEREGKAAGRPPGTEGDAGGSAAGFPRGRMPGEWPFWGLKRREASAF